MDGMGIAALGSGLWAFPPSRDSDGGTSWLLHSQSGASVLVDVPLLSDEHLSWLQQQPPGWIVLTHRQGHGRCRRLQEQLGWPVLVQEQEAYLLPTLQQRHSFGEQRELEPGLRLLWTPGPTPGSCCLHWAQGGRDVLFCGRLLWPRGLEDVEMRIGDSTFHASRQQRSVGRLRGWLGAEQPAQIACAAGLGVLRGAKLVERGSVAIDTLIARN